MNSINYDRDPRFRRGCKTIGALGMIIGTIVALSSARPLRPTGILIGGLAMLVSWFIMALVIKPRSWFDHIFGDMMPTAVFFALAIPFVPTMVKTGMIPMRWAVIITVIIFVLHVCAGFFTGLAARWGERLERRIFP